LPQWGYQTDMGGKANPVNPPSTVQLSLEARAENAALARRAVADEAARAGLTERVTAAAQVVVTESFTNATRHAHASSEPGRVEVRVRGDEQGMMIAVRDSGRGFRPRVPDDYRFGGFGLGLIAALADSVELRRLDGGGTEIRARLDAVRRADEIVGEPVHVH
jgi:anti-sigma regulatory factor (Ser/Thr protein kinase)